MAGLLGVELLEELGGEGGVFSNECGGSVVHRCWGVDGRVGISGHASVVIYAEGVAAEGGVGLAMFEGLGPFLRLSAL